MELKTNNNNREIDYRFILTQIKSKWPIILISIFITTLYGWYFYKSSKISYEGKVSIFLTQRTNSKTFDVQNLLGINSGRIPSSIDNEQELIKSTEMIKNALQKTDWQISYFQIKKLSTVDVYKSAPFIIQFDSTSNYPVDLFFNIEILDTERFKINCEGSTLLYNYFTNDYSKNIDGSLKNISINLNKTCRFGDTITVGNSKFSISSRFITKSDAGREFKFSFNNLDNLAKKYSGMVSVAPSSENSSVLYLKLKDSNPIRLIEVVNELANEYIRFDLKRKNEVALKTINFIDNELANIRLDLSSSESNLETYKISNRFLELTEESKNVFNSYYSVDEQKANLEILKKYYQNLKKAIETNSDASDIALPSNAGTDDPILLTLLNNYITLINEKINLKATAKDKNPAMIQINGQIVQARKNILDLVTNKLDNINLTLDYFNKRESNINSKITTLPTNQRNLIGYERTFNLHNQLFIFLLQRRAEAQITAATNVADSFIIDPCKSNNISQIAEKKSQIYALSILVGLIIALIIIFIPSFIFDHFSSEKEVEKSTPFPVIGFIPHSREKSKNIILENPRSMISESYRKLRANINYIAQGESNIMVLIASDMPKSGKTFTSVNLANSYALSSKKTLIISADMRKNEDIDIPYDKKITLGLSDYLSKSCTLEEILIPTDVPNLFVIQAGTMPPNPAELIESAYCLHMFEKLKQMFNITIIDTPAISLFADTGILTNYSDINLLIIRLKQSNRSLVKKILNEWKNKSISKPAIIINDIEEISNSDKYGYMYYGYGYSNQKISFTKRLFLRLGISRTPWPLS